MCVSVSVLCVLLCGCCCGYGLCRFVLFVLCVYLLVRVPGCAVACMCVCDVCLRVCCACLCGCLLACVNLAACLIVYAYFILLVCDDVIDCWFALLVVWLCSCFCMWLLLMLLFLMVLLLLLL